MKRTRRFPRLVSGLVRWTSLCVSFALVLSFLVIIPVQRNGTSLAQGQGSPNGQGTRVPAPPPVVGPPAANLPNLDAVRRSQPDPPQTPTHLPSIIRSRRNPIEPRNGQRVGDPGTTLIAGSAGVPPAQPAERAQTPARKEASVHAGALKADDTSALPGAQLRMNRKRNHARARVRTPTPIGDDQYVQTFFSYALARTPNSGEQLYWNDILRAAYAKGQTSMVMAARELGKTLFESSEYAARGRSDHWYVYDLYETYLLRYPDAGGWAYWESQAPKIGREATRRAFDECGEFIYWVSTVTPNGSASSAVSSLISARVDPNNQTGDQLLARDCEWGVSLLGLPGRAGLDLGLGLSYSSLVWIRSGPYLYFDEDNGWPSPGFRLGFATIQEKYFDAQSGANIYLLIGSSGGRVELRQVGTSNVYEAADSSYLQLTDNGTGLLVRTTDGTQMSYSKFENEWRCTQIKDRNGNFITVNYDWHGHITNITDTLSRVVTFNYDVNANLISITQTWNGQTHTWATFGWGTQTIQTSFSGVAVSGAPNGTVVPVLNMVGFDDGTYSKFLYNSSGQATRITSYASDSNPLTDNHPRAYTAYDYDNPTNDCPRIIAARVWAENWNGLYGVPAEVVTQFSAPGDGSHQLTAPDGTIYKEFYGTGWQDGLTTQSEAWWGAVRQKWTTTNYTQDNTNVSYQTNPRVTEANVYDAAGNRRRTTVGYYTFTRPSGVSASVSLDVTEFAADAQTTLRRTHNAYDLSSAYLNLGFLGLLHETDVYDGSNALMSMTSYWYDWGAEHLQNQPGGVNPLQHDSSYNTSFTTRGNLCNVARHDVNDPNHPAHEFKYGYNTAGSVIFTRDHLWHQNFIGYTDAFADSVNRNSFAYPTTLTDADGYNYYLQYNYDFGARTRAQGPPPAGQSQGVIQTLTYDSAARLQQVTTTNNGAYTRYVYGPTYVQNYSTVNSVADEAYAIQNFDGAGRVITAASNHPGSTGLYRAVNTIYDLMGRAFKVSNPAETNASWSPTGDDAAGWVYTQQTYDWKDRPLTTTNQDGTQKSITYSACGCAGSDVTTLTDEMGRRQKVYSDALGRTAKTEVLNWNGTVYSTSANTFNALDQVTRVSEYQGTDTSSTYLDMTATFDGWGRLKTKHVPEQQVDPNIAASTDHTTWDYNNDDTIQKVTDARGANATYAYNARHLVTGISYAVPTGSNIPVTPSVALAYDAAGNRTSMTDGLGSVTYGYDQLSRLSSETRHFNDLAGSSTGGNYTLSYQYNLAGQLINLTDPLNAHIYYNHNVTGQVTSITGSGYAGTPTFASNLQYRAWGALKGLTYGNNLTLSASYNSRLEPTQFEVAGRPPQYGSSTVMKTQYQYYGDGALKYAHDLLDERFDRAVSFDQVGRMQETYCGSEARDYVNQTQSGTVTGPYRQSYGYDVWSNPTSRANRFWSKQTTFTATYVNGRNTSSFWQYDADGRVARENFLRYTFDAAGRNVTTSSIIVNNYTGGIVSQSRDGDGQALKRVETSHGVATTSYQVRSSVLGGKVVTELNVNGQLQVSHVYLGTQRLAEQGINFVQWNHTNPLTGSEGSSYTNGLYGADSEPDPLQVDVGFEDPYLYFEDPRPDSVQLLGGNSNGECTIEGMTFDCMSVMRLLAMGAAEECPNGDCGPHSITVQALNAGGSVVASSTFFVVHGQAGWDGSLDGTYNVIPEIGALFDVGSPAGAAAFVGSLDGADPELISRTGNNPSQGLNPVEGEKRWNDCMQKYLPGDHPGGRNKPTGQAVGAANRASGGSTNDAALILGIIAQESQFDPTPKQDHGPMQLTSWVSDYAKNHNLNIVVPGSYDPFPRVGKNRDRSFTGDYDANVQTGSNWIRYQRDSLNMSDWRIAYGWGPGPTADLRKAYADDTIRLRDMYAPFVNCLKTGQ
jgi:YD repeat-containing protein